MKKYSNFQISIFNLSFYSNWNIFAQQLVYTWNVNIINAYHCKDCRDSIMGVPQTKTSYLLIQLPKVTLFGIKLSSISSRIIQYLIWSYFFKYKNQVIKNNDLFWKFWRKNLKKYVFFHFFSTKYIFSNAVFGYF